MQIFKKYISKKTSNYEVDPLVPDPYLTVNENWDPFLLQRIKKFG